VSITGLAYELNRRPRCVGIRSLNFKGGANPVSGGMGAAGTGCNCFVSRPQKQLCRRVETGLFVTKTVENRGMRRVGQFTQGFGRLLAESVEQDRRGERARRRESYRQ